MKTFTKIDEYTLQVEKEESKIETHSFTREYLEQQLATIKNQKAMEIEARNKEIAEVEGYLAEMDKLVIVRRIEEVITPVEEVTK